MPIINMVYKKKKWWKPWANTIAYYPLKADFNDASSNNRNLTNSWATITTVGWVICGYWNGSSYSSYTGYSLGNSARTVSVWSKPNSVWSSDAGVFHISPYNTAWNWSLGLQYHNSKTVIQTSDWSSSAANIQATVTDWWHNIIITQTGQTVKLYVDGVLKWSKTNYPSQANAPTWWSLWAKFGSTYSEKFNWYISEAIFENKVRTDQEIADYYNQTKWNYGL